MNIFITGGSGFLGGAVIQVLSLNKEVSLLAAVRSSQLINSGIETVSVGDIDGSTQWGSALEGIEVLVHCAARAHIMDDNAVDPLSEFRTVNTFGTLNLAKQAAKAGVKRFIFVSSIKVNGEFTNVDKPFTADDVSAPADPYGLSKYEAEIGLREIAQETGMEIVIIRPPLVYGPGVKGNFVSMMRWLSKGVPLPLGAIHNSRSLVALGNLVDLIITCTWHPNAANNTFLVSDDEDISTTLLLSKLALALGSPKRLLPVPGPFLDICARILGKRGVAQRLLGSLQLDIDKTKEVLGWAPPFTVDESLKMTAQHFLQYK